MRARPHRAFLLGAWLATLSAAVGGERGVLVQGFDSWTDTVSWASFTATDGWAVASCQVRGAAGWYAPYSAPRCAWLQDTDVSSNTWIRTPLLPDGIGSLSFMATNVLQEGMNLFDIQTSTNGSNWVTFTSDGLDHSGWAQFAMDMDLRQPVYVRIVKLSDQGTNEYFGIDDITVRLPADVALSNLRTVPSAPTAADAVNLYVDAQAFAAASNLAFTAFYRFGFQGGFTAIAMTLASNGTYRTSAAIPAGYQGGVQYYVQCAYDGVGPTPVFIPAAGSNSPALYNTAASFSGVSRRQLWPASHRTGLTLTEILYNPSPRSDGRNLQFIEVFNTESMPYDLSGHRISGAVEYTFPSNTVLGGQGYVVVARDPAAFQATYAQSALGPLSTNLPAGGGTLRLRNRAGAVLLETRYDHDAPWPVSADGAGHSLVLKCPDYGLASANAWEASAYVGGSPGAPDPEYTAPLGNVVINEFLAHTDPPQYDFIELYNHSTATVSIAGCWLSDDPATPKFQIPEGTTLGPLGFIAFSTNDYELGFELSMHGEGIYLLSSDGTRMLDAVRFGPQQNGVATGRFPDGAPTFHELAQPTPALTNAPLWIRDVVINEIMYHPISEDRADEYIELHNRGAGPVDLSFWQLTDGVTFLFPQGTTIPAGGYLVVAADAAHLMAAQPQLSATNTVGNFSGSLADSGERVALCKPDNPDLPYQDLVLVDEVTYNVEWGKWTDGGGSSLELIDPRSDNRLGANWSGSDETRKAPWTMVTVTGALDNGNASYPPSKIQVLDLESGEFLIDDIEVLKQGVNYLVNGAFTDGINGWVPRGNHDASTLEAAEGYAAAPSLHVRAQEGGDQGANQIETTLSGLTAGDTNIVLRARARWLCGHRRYLLRLYGNWMEAAGTLDVPSNLGTPGRVNSRYATNAAPAISGVTHFPVLPQTAQPLLVTARIHDTDGIASAALVYRIDGTTNRITVTMNDGGTNGDAVAGDGLYSGRIPAQSANALVGFYVQAQDAAASPAVRTFPATAPARECLALFGQATPAGSFGTMRLWVAQATRTDWSVQPKVSNKEFPCTLVCNDSRIMYDVTAKYHGSPFTRPGGDPTSTSLHRFTLRINGDDDLMDDRTTLLYFPGPTADDTFLRERTAYWIANRMDMEFSNERYCHVYVNQVHKGSIYMEILGPNAEFTQCWVPDDANGDRYKIDDWFEFKADWSFANVDATLEKFTTTGGAKKQARYRWSWQKKPVDPADDSYQTLFDLVDVMNLTTGSVYDARVRALVDYEQVMRQCALRHIFTDWDGWCYRRGKNGTLYKPEAGKWKMFGWDFSFALGASGDATDKSPFQDVYDPVLSGKFFAWPRFRRAYWRALQDAVDGPLAASNCVPLIDTTYGVLQTNGVAAAAPTAVKTWLEARRTYLSGFILSMTNFPFRVTTAGFSTTNTTAAVAGVAPVGVADILVNGGKYEVQWTTDTNWTTTVPLTQGVNRVDFQALSRSGAALGTGTVSITSTAQPASPLGSLVISEIMYHSAQPGANFVEIFNRSTSRRFDMSGFRLDGVDFDFPAGCTIGPTQYLVVAENWAGYGAAYSNAEVVVGAYKGSLDNGGETLRLLMPDGTNGWVVLDEVRYGDSGPWPSEADGQGQSLQLLDPAEDNNRAGNWAATPTFLPANWTFASVTGVATGTVRQMQYAELRACLGGRGSVVVDQMSLVAGAVPESGSNKVPNGDFESPLAGTWLLSGNHASSTVTNTAHSGLYALDIEASGPGNNLGDQCVHAGSNQLSLTSGNTYTLSYWYLQHPTATNLTVEVHMTDVKSRHSAQPPLNPQPRYTPGSANVIATNLLPFPSLWINEVMPSNVTAFVDNYGDHEPWVEILNADTVAVDLSSFALSDRYEQLGLWQFPTGQTIAAGQRLLIWTDAETNEATTDDLHANFRLNGTEGHVALSRSEGGRWTVIDYLDYSLVPTDASYGSYPEGDPRSRIVFHSPTPAEANSPTSAPVQVRINEWMADNEFTIADPVDGDHEDWFELFNAGDAAVDLTGYRLTDDLAGSNRWIVPGGVVIAPQSYQLVWADNETGQNQVGGLHAGFNLKKTGESIALLSPGGELTHSVTFGAQRTDVSEGLWPNGTGPVQPLARPTPGASNIALQITALVDFTADQQELAWPTAAGRLYRVDYVDSLLDTNWAPLGTVTALTETTSLPDTNAVNVLQRFYRLIELQ